MDDITIKIKLWAELIDSEKLEDVLKDIQMNICVPLDSKLNKYIYKLLVHLTHTANKCNKQNCITGKRIAELTKLLCSLLIEIPDNKNYVTCLYHIIRCLISFNLYENAADICCYLQHRNLYNPEKDIVELLVKILSLWQTPINNIYLTLTTETLDTESYNNLKDIIKYEMKMIQIAYKNYTRYLIGRINTHLDKIAGIDKKSTIYFDDFYKYILKYLVNTKLCLNEYEKYAIYCYILRIICCVISKTIDTTNIKYVAEKLAELSSYFKNLLVKDEECYQCFQQFQNLCIILLVPVENFVSDSAKNIETFICSNLKLIQKYGYTEAVKWNTLGLGQIFDPICRYWEICIKSNQQCFIDTGILLQIINLIIHMSIVFIKNVLNKCNLCLGNCTVKKDIYNAVIIKCRCVNLLTKFPSKSLPKEICIRARKILEQDISLIQEMRECKCKRWTLLWDTCGTLIYNMGIAADHIYEESTRLFSLLCTCIFQFEKVGSHSKYLTFEDPLSSTLHRLTAVHFNNDMYRKAMTACALNALLTYNQPNTKAFKMWINIKKKCAFQENTKLTILECLKADKEKIAEIGLTIDFSKYNLIQLCLRELKSLLEERIIFTDGVSTVLEELQKLKLNRHQYAHTIQLLGHYLLGFEYDNSILKYYKQAISDLKQDKSNSVAILCLEAHLQFFIFVEKLHIMNKQTQVEMENTQFALYAPKLPELQETKSPNIVPAYSMLNIKEDSSLMLSFQKCLEKWNQLFKCDINEIIKHLEPDLILRILITAGEYSRLYRYENCEIEIWKLAYRLASKIDDYYTIIYVTGRSISLRQINYDWIINAEKYAIKHRNSTDGNIIFAIAIFWISLADFYFECGKYDDAKKLLTEARSLPEISFTSNTSVYLLSLDTIIRNCNLYKDNIQREDYGLYIVECLYAMINLTKDSITKKWKNQARYLFCYDVLFTTTVNLSLRVNSLLSFREICAHLVRRLKAAQSLGATMQTAELLKSLCYIDLSRTKVDDCEVKLQALEHMLDIETFQLSMNRKPVKTSVNLAITPTKIVEPVRNIPQFNNTSPVLGKEVFDLPKFVLHEDCNCYKCSNISYHYLVFATTYIRAQLYALRGHVAVALEYFQGALQIRQKLCREKKSVSLRNLCCKEINVERFSWQVRSHIIDYVLLLIDFCYFFKANLVSKRQEALNIANLAIAVCHKYKLEGHPLYVSAKELVLDNDSQPILESLDCSEFMVPQPHDIDISKFVEVPSYENICLTPYTKNYEAKESLAIRRKKNPVVFNLDKVNMILSEDEDNVISSPIASSKKFNLRPKLIRRKILEEYLSDGSSSNAEDSMPVERKKKVRTENRNNMQINKKSVNDVTISKISLVSNISKNLDVDKSDIPATTENVDELTETVKGIKINSNTKERRIRDTKQLAAIGQDQTLNQTSESTENIIINEKTNETVDSLMLTETINKLPIQEQKVSEIFDEKKSIRTTRRTLKQSIENVSISSANEVKTTRRKNTKLLVNNEVHGIKMTRSKKSREKPT